MSDTVDVRCPICDSKLMTITYRKPLELIIETVCKRCRPRRKIDVTFPHPLTGSPLNPLIAVV